MWRGYARQTIFGGDQDRERRYESGAQGVTRFGCSLHRCCLRGNRAHVAAQVGEVPLSRITSTWSILTLSGLTAGTGG